MKTMSTILYAVLEAHTYTLHPISLVNLFFFFFNDTATTEIYTLPLHDALPILFVGKTNVGAVPPRPPPIYRPAQAVKSRSEEHTSELQSHLNLVCRLLLEKKK